MVTVPLATGEIQDIELSDDSSTAARALVDDLSLYFEPGSGFDVRLADLVNSRVRPEGVANATIYMAQAARGEIPRREPVTLRRLGRLWQVIDGNSTVVAARAAGWTTIRAVEIDHNKPLGD